MPEFGIFLVYIFPHSTWIQRFTMLISIFSPNVGKHEPEKLQIRTCFMQWTSSTARTAINSFHYILHNHHIDFDVILLLGIIQSALVFICILSAALSIVLRTTNHPRWKKRQLTALFIGVLARKVTVSHPFSTSKRDFLISFPITDCVLAIIFCWEKQFRIAQN